MRAVMGLVAREVEVRTKEPLSTFASGLFKSLLFSILKGTNSSPELFQVVQLKQNFHAEFRSQHVVSLTLDCNRPFSNITSKLMPM